MNYAKEATYHRRITCPILTFWHALASGHLSPATQGTIVMGEDLQPTCECKVLMTIMTLIIEATDKECCYDSLK